MKKKMKKKINEFLKETIKIIIVALAAMLGITLQSCGVTKATINKPAAGTYTTVTITTANPMTTNVQPNMELKGETK